MLSSFHNLLIPILGGFIFVKYSKLTKYRALRDNGYVILFKSAVVGLSFYGISYIIWRVVVFFKLLDEKLIAGLHNFFLVNATIPVISSLLLMAIILFIINLLLDEDAMKKKVIEQDDDALEVMILEAYEAKKYIQVTLDTGKVYVGNVTDTYFRVNDEVRSIQLSPLSSGYRNNETQTLTLNIYYGLVYEQILNAPEAFEVKISDFSITIRYTHIISVSPFDPETYSQFQELDTIQTELF